MSERGKLQAFVFFVLSCAALSILAAGLSRLPFYPPQPFVWKVSQVAPPGSPHITFYGQAGLLVLLFIAALLSFLLTPEGRRRLAAFILIVAASGLCLFAAAPRQRQPVQPTPNFQAAFNRSAVPTPLPAPAARPIEDASASVPAWLVTGAALSLALLAAFGVVLLAWTLSRPRLEQPALAELAIAAQAALDTLEAGGDFGDAITRCYARMSQALQAERDLTRPSAMTVREFERLLIHQGLPEQPVHTLTRLFEQVRYGGLLPDETAIRQAASSLNAILSACQTQAQT